MTKPLLSVEWINRLERYSKLVVGFSGGLDSTVLLHVLSSYPALKPQLFAVHINHGISPNALLWQKHCEQFCIDSNIPHLTRSVRFDHPANLEEQARNARYTEFKALLKAGDCLVLGHHINDQAETVLLNLLRGSGIDGLAAMNDLAPCGTGEMARPFLTHSRQDLEDYALENSLQWIEDESNADNAYSRNYLRNKLFPMLLAKWPGAVTNMAKASAHCQQARSNLDDLALIDCVDLQAPQVAMPIETLKSMSFARISNVLRAWLKKNEIQMPPMTIINRLINDLIFARPDATGLISWGEHRIQRYNNYIYLDKINKNETRFCQEWVNFPVDLISKDNLLHLKANKKKPGVLVPPNAKIKMQFRQGGEVVQLKNQTKQLKKLLQEWQIPPWQRDQIPLIYINDELAVIVGYAVSDLFFSHDSKAWEIINLSK